MYQRRHQFGCAWNLGEKKHQDGTAPDRRRPLGLRRDKGLSHHYVTLRQDLKFPLSLPWLYLPAGPT